MSDDVGFFELAGDIWADCDARRKKLKRKYGAKLGNWLADIRQYGSAWQGDVWEWTAVGAENHMAFLNHPRNAPLGMQVLVWSFGADSAYWGGWKKPHKPEPKTDHHGLAPATQIGTPRKDGWVTLAVVQL